MANSLKCYVLKRILRAYPGLGRHRMCDKLAMFMKEFGYKFIILIKRIKDLVKKMEVKGGEFKGSVPEKGMTWKKVEVEDTI